MTYIPYSSWDGASFWIPSQRFGRDYPTLQDALDDGAFQHENAAAFQRYKEQGTALTYDEIVGKV